MVSFGKTGAVSLFCTMWGEFGCLPRVFWMGKIIWLPRSEAGMWVPVMWPPKKDVVFRTVRLLASKDRENFVFAFFFLSDSVCT